VTEVFCDWLSVNFRFLFYSYQFFVNVIETLYIFCCRSRHINLVLLHLCKNSICIEGVVNIALHLKWCFTHKHTHTHPFNSPLSGTTRVSQHQKGKPVWILLKQETLSGSGISWSIYKSAPRSRQITTPAPHNSVFTGWMPFLLPNQQRQSTEGEKSTEGHKIC